MAPAPSPEAVITTDAPAPVGPYNQAVKAGGLLFCSGQIALDPATGAMVGAAMWRPKPARCWPTCRRCWPRPAARAQEVVRTTVFLADLGDFAKVNALYAEVFGAGVSPARACVEVAALPKAARVEIDCIAVLG
jgi:reactive intermediate/imine deaminase